METGHDQSLSVVDQPTGHYCIVLTKSKSVYDLIKKVELSLTQKSALQRHHMIAEAAYFMAEARGFALGSETDDWLAAESAIDAATAQQGH